jgi:enediyne biosynthesis protein E4
MISPYGLRGLLPIALAGALALSCQPSVSTTSGPEIPSEPEWFIDATSQVGLGFIHDPGKPPGPNDIMFMPQIMGSGCALFDFDGDGRLDIYLVQNAGPNSQNTNRLYHQEPDGRFRDVSKGSGLDVAGFGMGVAIGDVNNDGFPDVFLMEYGRTRLFRNNGNGTFTDISKEAGFDAPHWASSAAFFDFDRDGWLDLAVVNYVDYDPSIRCSTAGGRSDYCHPGTFPGTVVRLYRNLGASAGSGRIVFEDVTIASGLGRLPGPGLGVLCADFDGDGWPDIFVANDGQANRLWLNQHNGTFVESAVARGLAYNATSQAQANMGVAFGDVNGDGLPDLFVTHLTDEYHALWKQIQRGHFQDRSAAYGITATRWRGTGFGTVLADFNCDGWLDLAWVNGRVSQRKEGLAQWPADFFKMYAERNQLMANDGTGKFRDISPSNPAFCGKPAVARGLAVGDIDGDGAPDLLLTEIGGPARVLLNRAPNRGHWLTVRAMDPKLNRDAYGAEVRVKAGGRDYVRCVNPGSSYQSSSDPRVYFGLGAADKTESIHVRWPDGSAETFAGGPADRSIELKKGAGRK